MNLHEITEAFVKLNKEDLIAKERKRLITALRKVLASETVFEHIPMKKSRQCPTLDCLTNDDGTPDIFGTLVWDGIGKIFSQVPDLLVLEQGTNLTYLTRGLREFEGEVNVELKNVPYVNLMTDETDEDADEYDDRDEEDTNSYHGSLYAFSKQTVKSEATDLIAALSVAYPNVAALIN